MGNNNCSETDKTKNVETNIVKNNVKSANEGIYNEGIYNEADEIYDRIWDNKKKIYIERKIEIYNDPARGISLPYSTDKYAFESDKNNNNYQNDQIITSENPRYIEFIVCKGNMNDFKEKFAVNKFEPAHECKGNCQCIEETYEVIGNKSKRYDKSNNSDQSKQYQQSHNNYQLSPTSAESYDPSKKNNNSLWGGNAIADMDDSPEEITDSPEDKNYAFSTTSDMSTTSSTAANSRKMNQDKNKKTIKKKNIDNKLFDSTDEDDDEKDDTDTDTDTDTDNDKDEEDDDDDEDLEGLDEELTEDGIILEQSDISSSDLYRMQSRVFASNTEDSSDYKMNKNIKNNNRNTGTNRNTLNNRNIQNKNRNRRDASDKELTEQMRKAMKQMNARDTIFDSDDREIMNMNSSTDKYMKRPTKKNSKYY